MTDASIEQRTKQSLYMYINFFILKRFLNRDKHGDIESYTDKYVRKV